MKCDMNCPVFYIDGVYCCRNCHTARAYYKTGHEEFWTDKRGFLTDKGCALPRDLVPEECKEYDCRKERFYLGLAYHKGKWTVNSVATVTEIDKEFIDAYNALMEKYR